MKTKKASNKKLTVFQGAAIVNGYGVGAGILVIPYLANKVGIWLSLLIIVLSFIFIYVLHLMIADLTIKTGKNAQILDIFEKYIIKGKASKVIRLIVFAFMFVVLTSNLCAYIAGASSILSSNMSALPDWAWKLIFYAFAAVVALFGLKILGFAEQGATIAIFVSVGALIIGSFFHLDNSFNFIPESASRVIGFFGVAMFAFNAFFCVPQVVSGLDGDEKKIRKSIGLGMLFNAITIVLVMIFAVLSSEGLKEGVPCTDAWADGIGDWARAVGCLFTVLAMFSTYWSVSFALRDILKNELKISFRLCWLIATLPSIIISLILSMFVSKATFDIFIDVAFTALALLIGGLIIPSFHIARKENKHNILGYFGNTGVELIAAASMMLMAAGGIINIVKSIQG